ncbi:MAG: BatA domain-containing protein [Caldimonas sp.]
MLTFATPLWLAGLALVPAIRWLHRGGPHRREVAVSRLALWRDAQASRQAAGDHRPPDPAWRRRALLAALLSIALAGPQWSGPRVRVTLWIDDSLSMLTREAQTTRLAEGLARARSLLAELPRADVEVRTLADPWNGLGALTDRTIATVVASAGRKEPAAPPAELLRSASQQWLLTDGADATLLAWPGERRPDRVVQVGGPARNVGLEALSARRHADDPATFDLLLKVSNGGTADEDRAVVFTTGAVEVARASVSRLRAGSSQRVEVSILASASVRASLQPPDALPDDDEIALDLAPLRRRRVAVDAACPTALAAAVATHPALVVASSAREAEVALDCGSIGATGAPADLPTIRVLVARAPTRPRGALQWSSAVPQSRRIELDTDRLQIAAHVQAQPDSTVLLAIGDEPVVTRRAGQARRLETSFDFAAMGAARGPELPRLVNWLFESVLDRGLLDEIAVVDRGPRSVLVVPQPIVGAPPVPPAATVVLPANDEARPVLLVALLALLWEVVALVRQGFRLRAPAMARSG